LNISEQELLNTRFTRKAIRFSHTAINMTNYTLGSGETIIKKSHIPDLTHTRSRYITWSWRNTNEQEAGSMVKLARA
jgi:hypothetical protein